jgi:hypothetical protein
MNADTSTPHVDLADLIAEANGQATGDRVRTHLAGCEECQLEANRWSLVAGGVRGLMAATPEVAQPVQPVQPVQPIPLAHPVQPRHPVRRMLATPRRRLVLAASAAAALVLVGFAGYGLANVVSVNPPGQGGSGSTATLTAVTGCTRLEQATGTLERVDGDSVAIRTAGGKLATVATTATTRLNASGPLLAAITDGATVTVAGKASGGSLAASFVAVGGKPTIEVPGYTVARGTVSDARTGGFTVVTSTGTRTPVTTSGRTVVTISSASLSQLRTGARTTAVGYAAPDGTLSAIAVFQPADWLPGAHAEVTVKDCSQDSIDHAIMALTYGG